jgi:uncharacterized protein with von Willebrand factor type A (vWA) domain
VPDPRTLVRWIDELLWRLRREGFAISVAQALDVARAIRAVGLSDRAHLREAVACVVVLRRQDRESFETAFGRFFDEPGGEAYARMAALEFTTSEIDTLRRLVEELDGAGVELDALLRGGADVDRRIARAGLGEAVDAEADWQLGFQTHRLLRGVGIERARSALPRLRARLAAAMGSRGEALAGEVAAAIERLDAALRTQVRRTFDRRVALRARAEKDDPLEVPFESLDEERGERVRRAVRVFAERLTGAARVRRRRARRGRVDVRRTLRRSSRTAGVPFVLVRRRSRRSRPRLVVLCDVSESMRAAARFMLQLTAGAQEIFEEARSFVFVSELGETTDLFRGHAGRAALDAAWRGAGRVRTDENSNYGRALRAFERTIGRELDRRTIVVVLGDGRTHQHDAAPEVLDRIRARVRALLWLCPEARSRWAVGDSAMLRYAPRCTRVFEVRSVADLERAARSFVR